MKLFMEINPQLFDDCSHDYTELQNNASNREQARQSKWDRLSAQAAQAHKPKTSLGASQMNADGEGETDTMTQDSQKRLDALKLHDEIAAAAARPTSVSSQPFSILSHFLYVSLHVHSSMVEHTKTVLSSIQ